MSTRPLRVLIAYNQPVLPADHPDAASEYDVLETVVEVEKVLPAPEYEVQKIGYARTPAALLARLAEFRPDVVFNLFEGEADRTETEVSNAALLEWLGVPFTGAPSYAMALGRDKIRTKYLLQGAGLPTAPFLVVDRLPAPRWPFDFPVILKPACQDSSVGIDQKAVATSQAELDARAEYLFGRFGGPVLVERFLFGREFHVNMFDERGETLHVVPPAEIRFNLKTEEGYWPVYTYEGKWNEESVEYKSTPLDTGLTLASPLKERVEAVCQSAYRLLGLRDYGRVDLRVTADDQPYVLEVNPNPYLNSLFLVDGLTAMGRTFPDFVHGLIANAAARSQCGK